ncbi:MAG: Peptidase M23 [Parcubacteria group bacterium LiPW_15]|nr:MAG: Peptidase M23 [Parcubacteria group bacterium LiPW_15]
MTDLLKKTFSVISTLIIIMGPSNSLGATTAPQTREELEQQIKDRSKQLETLNQAIQTTQNTLKDVQGQKTTLQKEVKTLDTSLKQLDLSIQSDRVNAQKINYQIDSIDMDIEDIEASVLQKNSSISDLFRELQRNQDKNTLMIFLENKTISEGLLATKSLEDIRSQLAVDIQSLKELKDQYRQKMEDLSVKHKELVYHEENLKNRKQITEETKQERATLLSQTKEKESVYQKQLADLKKLQEDIANEMEAMDAQLRSKVDPKFLPPLSSGVLGYPIQGDKSDMTQSYGATAFAKYGYKGKWHNGIDFGVPIGTPIFAAETGIILATGNQDSFCYKGAYGKFVLIKHENNLTSLYGHLSKYIVSPGQKVERGQVIGYSGKTGYATGPHLHFSVFATPTIPPATGKYPEGISPSKSCGPMPYGGDLNPLGYL